MKKQALRVFTILSFFVALAVMTVSAQFSGRLVATIPFDFIVGGQTLPAGEYTVAPHPITQDLLVIQGVDGSATAMVLTVPVQASRLQDKAKLTFNRYGDQYFLSQLWVPGDNIGRELLMSRQERELAKKASRPQVASVTGNQQ